MHPDAKLCVKWDCYFTLGVFARLFWEMNMKNLGVSALIIASSCLCAQELGQFNGEWMGIYEKANDKAQQVSLTITDQGGSWHAYQGGKKNPCVKRDFPISVEQKSLSEILVRVSATEIIPGCNNSTLSLKLISPNKLEGSFVGSGIPVFFEKQ